MPDKFERRVFIRFTGEEAEYLLNLLQGDDAADPHPPALVEKLRLALGRADRLHKVLTTNPPRNIDDWENDDKRYKGFTPRKY